MLFRSYSNGDASVEYPVVTGAIMWAIAKITPSGEHALQNYYYANIALLALLFIFISLVVAKMRPEFAYLTPLAPAAIASLYINWDLWAIVTTLLAIYWFDRKEELASAAILGVSIATKFFPIVLLLPIAIIYIRRQEVKNGIRYIATTLGTFIAINIPFALTTPTGWWRFYDLNLHREADWGSIWYALSVFGLNLDRKSVV
mgnify:CR=1 FL=1